MNGREKVIDSLQHTGSAIFSDSDDDTIYISVDDGLVIEGKDDCVILELPDSLADAAVMFRRIADELDRISGYDTKSESEQPDYHH